MRYLVAVDGSNNAKAAVRYLVEQVIYPSLDPKRDHLLIVSVVDRSQVGSPMLLEQGAIMATNSSQVALAKSALHSASKRARLYSIPHTTVLCMGRPGEAIVSLCRDKHIDVVCCGSMGLSPSMNWFKRTFLGSVSDYVKNNAPCKTIVVTPSKHARASSA